MPIAVFAALIVSCSGGPQGRIFSDAQVTVSPHPWPTAEPALPAQAPRILALWLNETSIPNGTDWIGRIATTTNVASVEVRTESFSFNADRTQYGEFRFRQRILDMVPQYKRGYTLQVVARNAAGRADTVLVPIRFQ